MYIHRIRDTHISSRETVTMDKLIICTMLLSTLATNSITIAAPTEDANNITMYSMNNDIMTKSSNFLEGVLAELKALMSGSNKPVPKCETCGKSGQLRVMGGDEAAQGEFPWMVVLRNDSTVLCGGTLVGSSYILTAAHCIIGRKMTSLTAILGSQSVDGDDRMERKIVDVRIHEEFNENTKMNDIALLRLHDSVTFSRTVNTICMPPADMAIIGYNATVAGWGYMNNGKLSSVLMKAHLPVVSNAECQEQYIEKIHTSMMCAGFRRNGDMDACEGDSGGPLMVRSNGQWFQVGIVSWAEGCRITYGVYTRVTSFLDWIEENTRDDKCRA